MHVELSDLRSSFGLYLNCCLHYFFLVISHFYCRPLASNNANYVQVWVEYGRTSREILLYGKLYFRNSRAKS